MHRLLLEKYLSYTLSLAFSFHLDKITILMFRILNLCRTKFSKISLRAFVLDVKGVQKKLLWAAKISLSVINLSFKMQNASCEYQDFPTRSNKFPVSAGIKIFLPMTSINPHTLY